MKQFALLFRQPSYDINAKPAEEIRKLAIKWKEWIGGIEEQGKLKSGVRLVDNGKVLKSEGVVSDGPFVEIRERLGSLLVVTAENLEEALTLAHGCPALDAGGSVEVREVLGSR